MRNETDVGTQLQFIAARSASASPAAVVTSAGVVGDTGGTGFHFTFVRRMSMNFIQFAPPSRENSPTSCHTPSSVSFIV